MALPPTQGAKETPFRALFLLAHPAGNLGDNVCPISLSPQVTVMSMSPVSSMSPAELHSTLLWQSLLGSSAPQSNKLQDVTQAWPGLTAVRDKRGKQITGLRYSGTELVSPCSFPCIFLSKNNIWASKDKRFSFFVEDRSYLRAWWTWNHGRPEETREYWNTWKRLCPLWEVQGVPVAALVSPQLLSTLLVVEETASVFSLLFSQHNSQKKVHK